MDIEKLKEEWSAMNDRVEKQEIFKEKIFSQMLNTKLDKSHSWLMSYEVVSVIFSILCIPVLVYMFNIKKMEFVRIVAVGGIVFLGIYVFWSGFKIFILSKVDMMKTLKNNLFYINKYDICMKYEKLIGYYFLIPLIIASCVIHYTQVHASLFAWVFMLCMVIATLFFTIYYYGLYKKNISTVRQNLEELRELQEK